MGVKVVRAVVVVLAWAVLAVALEGCDPASVYGPLKGQWTAQTNAPIAAKPAVGESTAYVGSWDGNEYAFDEASGAVAWSTNLGVTQTSNCGTQGVTSSPWLRGGIAYLGGGGSTWDALDTATGSVLWTVPTGDNSSTGGHYNWSSPVVYNGHAYVGIASFCDEPLVQGELLRVNLTTHQIENVFKVVPDGQVGGSIWTNPVVDPTTNTVYVTTGNGGQPNQPYAPAVVALDATTLAVKSSWLLPGSNPTLDLDFATSPVLFTDSGGRALIAVTNKNGMLYAFQRSNLSAGPVWQTQIAASVAVCVLDGCGSFSTGLFDGTRLYYAAGQTTIGGQTVGGSIRAIDPTTGAFLWERALPAWVYGALAGANGMIAVPSSDGGLYVVRATDGAVLYANGLTGAPGASAIFGAPTIADGYLFIGTTDGVVHAFTFPASAGAAQALSHATVSRNWLRAGSCAATRGAVLTADCRLAVAGRARCTRLGQLPAAAGTVIVDRLTTRETGRGRRLPATVGVYTDGSCAGRPAIRLRLTNGQGAPRITRPWVLPPGTVMSIAASRALQLDLRVVGHSRRAAPAGRSRLPTRPTRSLPPGLALPSAHTATRARR
jgi:outer membrane protein assembly factor BamB